MDCSVDRMGDSGDADMGDVDDAVDTGFEEVCNLDLGYKDCNVDCADCSAGYVAS